MAANDEPPPEQIMDMASPFPAPPSHYTRYTMHNLHLLALLNERTTDVSNWNQKDVLSDQKDVPDWSLTQLEKPRVDWILDEPEPFYTVFGQPWPLRDRHSSIAEHGGTQLYPPDPSVDRRPALLSILRSLLVAYSNLISTALIPPISGGYEAWNTQADWLTTLAQNLMGAANELRPMQARANLESMMKRQLELRKQETAAIHAKCDELEAKLEGMRATAKAIALAKNSTFKVQPWPPSSSDSSIHPSTSQTNMSESAPVVGLTEVLRWAEELS
ncbi:hypothetical protein HGRIS_008149 [Hohenbuehelia grisea]|uniref:Mediator of RNA polymerase II transcription subunit 7 n=1 Tax=Hohenbuehelia grisea TaxID=104357 RepID=A0ABR3J7W1_9AGAR